MSATKQIKYGFLYGPRCIIKAWPLAASINFEPRSGKFMDLDANNRLQLADSGQTDIKGWAETGADWTSSSTAGADEVGLDISHFAIFGLPADADPANVRGETCDLIVNSNRQQADIGESNEDILHIIDANTTDDVVAVHLVSRNITYAGVA